MKTIHTYTEQQIVRGCVRNERACQELLYRKHFSKMMSLCMRYTKDKDKATEIVNDGFLRIFKKIESFEFKGSLEGWIRRIMYNSISDYFRKNKIYNQQIVHEFKDSNSTTGVLDELYFQDLLEIIGVLPNATQEVFRLYVIEGYKHKEIAERLNISEGTSKWHLSSARKKLQQIIKNTNKGFRLYAG